MKLCEYEEDVAAPSRDARTHAEVDLSAFDPDNEQYFASSGTAEPSPGIEKTTDDVPMGDYQEHLRSIKTLPLEASTAAT